MFHAYALLLYFLKFFDTWKLDGESEYGYLEKFDGEYEYKYNKKLMVTTNTGTSTGKILMASTSMSTSTANNLKASTGTSTEEILMVSTSTSSRPGLHTLNQRPSHLYQKVNSAITCHGFLLGF